MFYTKTLTDGDKVSIMNMKGTIKITDTVPEEYDAVVSPQSIVRQFAIGLLTALTAGREVFMCIHYHIASTKVSASPMAQPECPHPRSQMGQLLKSDTHGPGVTLGEMDADVAMCYSEFEMLQHIWDRSDMTSVLMCRKCSMLHHNCSCVRPRRALIRLPMSTVVVNACWGAAGYSILYKVE